MNDECVEKVSTAFENRIQRILAYGVVKPDWAETDGYEILEMARLLSGFSKLGKAAMAYKLLAPLATDLMEDFEKFQKLEQPKIDTSEEMEAKIAVAFDDVAAKVLENWSREPSEKRRVAILNALERYKERLVKFNKAVQHVAQIPIPSNGMPLKKKP